MRYVWLAILSISFGIGLGVSAQTPTKTGPKANIAAGKELFLDRCSTGR